MLAVTIFTHRNLLPGFANIITHVTHTFLQSIHDVLKEFPYFKYAQETWHVQPEFRDFYKLEVLCSQNQLKFPKIQYNTDFSFVFFLHLK